MNSERPLIHAISLINVPQLLHWRCPEHFNWGKNWNGGGLEARLWSERRRDAKFEDCPEERNGKLDNGSRNWEECADESWGMAAVRGPESTLRLCKEGRLLMHYVQPVPHFLLCNPPPGAISTLQKACDLGGESSSRGGFFQLGLERWANFIYEIHMQHFWYYG